MDDRTFWLGLLGGIVGGALLIGAGYLAIRAYLPSRDDDPLVKMKSSFLESGTILSRSSIWDEIMSPRYDREPAAEPMPGIVS